MKVLELENVTKRYGALTAVNGVSISIEEGKVLSLLGPSGCGKTTTLRVIAGFTSPDNGTVQIAGKNVGHLRPYERNVGLLFQDYALFPHMTVAQNVAYGMRYRGYQKPLVPARVAEMLSLVRLSGMGDRYPKQLSGGQQQRVALARALATDPQIVLLDEPLSALDAKLRVELRVELKEILSSVGATTIVVTHDQEEALSLGDEVIVMNAGRIAQRGSPTEIYAKPADKFVAEFVGRSNWFHATGVTQSNVNGTAFSTSDDVEIRSRQHPDAGTPAYDLCVRPEHIDIIGVDSVIADDPEYNLLIGKVVDVSLLGADMHVVVELPTRNRLLVVRKNTAVSRKLLLGQPIRIRFSATDVLLFKSR
ncbi:ABC transporter ATP-binding protein (plasmid) [Mesorhizobium sp. AR07]|uniref:ABC transporter ATP-binding protein n=1 Tax=Mesorhizobium sp. AR07 TaxID=2865838 RepID=UPI00215FDCF8|nr:ABC transporter ATP-binding protein [Mesorhizobium sp. AR07]UVK49010.1 ABC transporter ATP-binding protein [Mesorhizobium sp. AR07]